MENFRINKFSKITIDSDYIEYDPRNLSEKLSDYTSVIDYGADNTGVIDSTDFIQDALNSSLNVYFPEGMYKIDGTIYPRPYQCIRGSGMRSTTLQVDTPSTETCIVFGTSDSIHIIDLRISNGTSTSSNPTGNCVSIGDPITSGLSVNNRFTRVWFGPCGTAVHAKHAMYWTTFTDCIFRECDKAFLGNPILDGYQICNALTFTGCTFFRDSSIINTYAVEIESSDGISFNGCQIQNHGFKFKNCVNISLTGGYYEGYNFPILELENSSTVLTGVFLAPGSIYKFDISSIELMTGSFGPFAFGTSTTPLIETTNYITNVLIPIASKISNMFPDHTCSTIAAINSQNGIIGDGSTTLSIVGGEVKVELLTAGAQATYTIPSINFEERVCVLTKFRCTSGKCTIIMKNSTPGQVVEIDSAITSDTVLYCSSPEHKVGSGDMYLRWMSVDGAATVYVERLIVSQGKELLTNENRVVNVNSFSNVSILDPTTFIVKNVVVAATTTTNVFTLPYDGVFRVVVYDNISNDDYLLDSSPYTIFELIVTTATISGGIPTTFNITETDIKSSVLSPSTLVGAQSSRLVELTNSGGSINTTVKITVISAVF